YGPFTISQAISVTAPLGVYAGISVMSGTGIAIAAGASDGVALHGLTVTGLGGGSGISFSSGDHLDMTGCPVFGFSGSGIGLVFAPSAPSSRATVEHSSFADSNIGAWVSPTGNLTLRNCVISGNSSFGVYMLGVGANGGATLSVVDCLIDGNDTGVFSG